MNIATAKPGFFVQDRFLYSKDNEKVILRGINHMFIWTDREGKTIPEMAKTGANCVRIVWNTRGRISDLDSIVAQSISNGMIPIVELHDTTGNWDKLPEVVDFWLRDEMLQMINNHQEYLILNVGNEPGSEAPAGGPGTQPAVFHPHVVAQRTSRPRSDGLFQRRRTRHRLPRGIHQGEYPACRG